MAMRERSRHRTPLRLPHPRGLVRRLLESIRGREQLLVRPPAGFPLLLLSYPRGSESAARLLESAYLHTLPALPRAVLEPYGAVLAALPALVVVLLRPENPCGCLGHFHPRGAESRLTRRLAADLGSPVAEIDLAFETIRAWKPQPLSSLAAGEHEPEFAGLHFQAALLAVLLHELHHLALPEADERQIRAASNNFYTAVMRELVREAGGADYGMMAEPRPASR
jgi:hypothetical protein